MENIVKSSLLFLVILGIVVLFNKTIDTIPIKVQRESNSHHQYKVQDQDLDQSDAKNEKEKQKKISPVNSPKRIFNLHNDKPQDCLRKPCGHLGNCNDNCNVPFPFECKLPNPGYKEHAWSVLDAVPPPDPDHQYREDTFFANPLCMPNVNGKPKKVNDYDRWEAAWQPNENYSAKYLDWSNDFLF